MCETMLSARSDTPVLDQHQLFTDSVENSEPVDESSSQRAAHPSTPAPAMPPTLPLQPQPLGTVRSQSLRSQSASRSLSSSAPARSLVDFAASTCTGSIRKLNQDQFSLERFSATLVFGVWDGHGPLGHNASLLCDKIVPARAAALVASGIAPDLALKSAFADAQQCLLQVSRAEEGTFSGLAHRKLVVDYGTTGSCCLVMDRVLWVANVGDSRTVVFQRAITESKHKTAPPPAQPPSQPATLHVAHVRGRKRGRRDSDPSTAGNLRASKQQRKTDVASGSAASPTAATTDVHDEKKSEGKADLGPSRADSTTSSAAASDFDYDGWHEVFASVDHNPAISQVECARVKRYAFAGVTANY